MCILVNVYTSACIYQCMCMCMCILVHVYPTSVRVCIYCMLHVYTVLYKYRI